MIGKYDAVNQLRKKYWLAAALGKVVQTITSSPKKSIWIFGAWHGNRYDDNARYLFEYICEEYPMIDAYWLSNNQVIVEDVRSRGYKSELSDSREGKRLQHQAGFSFYTNGIDDFSYRPKMLSSRIVSLWHGEGVKNIYYGGDERTGLRCLARRFRDSLFSWVQRDLSIASSSVVSAYISNCFWVNGKDIEIAGQARNSQLLQARRSGERGSYLLYMPTYRRHDNHTITNALRQFASSAELEQYCIKNNTKLKVKLHYLTQIEPIESNYLPSWIELVHGDTPLSTQQLLLGAELLITDYSSCAIDFSILNRPILLYTPDLDSYLKDADGIVSYWLELYKDIGISGFSDLMGEVCSDSGRGMTVSHWIQARYFSEDLLRYGSLEESVVDAIRRHYPDMLELLGPCKQFSRANETGA